MHPPHEGLTPLTVFENVAKFIGGAGALKLVDWLHQHRQGKTVERLGERQADTADRQATAAERHTSFEEAMELAGKNAERLTDVEKQLTNARLQLDQSLENNRRWFSRYLAAEERADAEHRGRVRAEDGLETEKTHHAEAIVGLMSANERQVRELQSQIDALNVRIESMERPVLPLIH